VAGDKSSTIVFPVPSALLDSLFARRPEESGST
jgi:hypothetical protein